MYRGKLKSMKAMVKARSAAACVVASLVLLGCGSGEGLDAKLASESEAAYRTSLNLSLIHI